MTMIIYNDRYIAVDKQTSNHFGGKISNKLKSVEGVSVKHDDEEYRVVVYTMTGRSNKDGLIKKLLNATVSNPIEITSADHKGNSPTPCAPKGDLFVLGTVNVKTEKKQVFILSDDTLRMITRTHLRVLNGRNCAYIGSAKAMFERTAKVSNVVTASFSEWGLCPTFKRYPKSRAFVNQNDNPIYYIRGDVKKIKFKDGVFWLDLQVRQTIVRFLNDRTYLKSVTLDEFTSLLEKHGCMLHGVLRTDGSIVASGPGKDMKLTPYIQGSLLDQSHMGLILQTPLAALVLNSGTSVVKLGFYHYDSTEKIWKHQKMNRFQTASLFYPKYSSKLHIGIFNTDELIATSHTELEGIVDHRVEEELNVDIDAIVDTFNNL